MLQNGRVTAFTVSELLRENHHGGREEVKLPPPTQIRYKNIYFQEHLRELFFLFWLQYGTLFDYKLGTLQLIFQKFYIYWNESMTALFV